MIRRLGQTFVGWAHRFMPDPFVFALLLTFLTLLLGVLFTPHGLSAMLGFWGDGFWGFLTFAMQMSLILVTGHALAQAPPVRRGLDRLVSLPRTPTQAVVTVAVASCVAAWINWGFGLIVGALLARDVGRMCERNGILVHYPLLGAAGYTGLGIWHGGLSGSAPLDVAQPDHALVSHLGVLSLHETVLSSHNLIVTALLLLVIPLVLAALMPHESEREPASRFNPQEEEAPEAAPPTTPAERLESSPLLGATAAAMGLGWWLVARPGLDLNSVNFLFLCLGLLLHGSPKRYGQAVAEGAQGVSGILLQFPFYAGIAGMMGASGLIGLIADQFVHASAVVWEATRIQVFGVLSFLSAGLVNLFVPSGGGQWKIQGPIVVEAAQRLNLGQARAVMAVAYGDQWTNMLQPFWALPLLAITGLKARDLIGYTIPVMLATGTIFALALLV